MVVQESQHLANTISAQQDPKDGRNDLNVWTKMCGEMDRMCAPYLPGRAALKYPRKTCLAFP